MQSLNQTSRTFEERRGKHIFSTSHCGKPKYLKCNINFNYFTDVNNGNCKFSITVADDNKTVFVDIENCAVMPLERYRKLVKLQKRSKTFLGRLKEAWRILINTTEGK